MSRRHHKRRRSLQAQRELFRELDERELAQYQLATATQDGFTKRIDQILEELKLEKDVKEGLKP
jgi:hypothetical protein